jgi:hypothetical protein
MQSTYLVAAALAFPLTAATGSFAAPFAFDDPVLGGNHLLPIHSTCHDEPRTHGGSYPRHIHDDDDCDVIIVEGPDDDDDEDDCHANVQRHFIPGYGRVWHRHRGNDCDVIIYEEESGPRPGVGGCISVGPLTVCPP